ncbi:PAS domain S-box protein [Planktothrix mougeotii]|uniref:histidine kinase n=1 Tax=Planktothrix mougeotii LEGE 06226 TaxID=1828728 RepID=A0ABR9UAK3_9CYAN|nr:PAS domain S-box protein [Planktothrix mougeotii]MBE9143452.1 PAS domain S-box protein [Planktothrix mougeotii LEGE 06226]
MDDDAKTKTELIEELQALRAEVAMLKQKSGVLQSSELPHQELIQSEQLFAGFFNAATQSNVGLFIVDKNLRFLHINQVLADINGYSIPDHLGQLLPDLLPELAPTLTPLLQTLIETKQPISNLEISGYVPSQPGVLRHCINSFFPISSTAGDVIAVGGIVLEITEYKQVIEALRQSEFNLRTAQRIAHVGSWQWQQDDEKIIWSEEIYRIHGLDPNSAVPDAQKRDKYIHPDDLDIYQAMLNASVRGEPYEFDLRIIRPDGEIRYIEARGEPGIFNERGEPILLFGTVLDVTDRKRVEATLQESNRRWRSLLDQVQLMVVGLDAQGVVEYVNPFFLQVTGYKESEVIGQEWFKTFVVPEEWQVSRAHFVDLLEQRVPYSHYQNRIITKSGEERIIVWDNTVLQDTTGNPISSYLNTRVIGIIGIGKDITEQHKLERLKSEFVSIVSHELRTPLTSMQVALSLLDQQWVDPTSEDGQGMIHVTAEGVDRLVRLVNDILDLERLESGKVHIEKQSCYPRDLIQTAINQMKDLANQSDIQFEVSVVSYPIQADPDRLIQVLTNLLSNAIRFSPCDSIIKIQVERFSSMSVDDLSPVTCLQFMIQDQGCGIPSHQLESIFERFQQLDASDSRSKGGTGLGLAICRSIIEQHGGRIWAESNLEIGKGSCFYFTLPILEGDQDGKETDFID